MRVLDDIDEETPRSRCISPSDTPLPCPTPESSVGAMTGSDRRKQRFRRFHRASESVSKVHANDIRARHHNPFYVKDKHTKVPREVINRDGPNKTQI